MTNIASAESLSGAHKFRLITYWETIVYFDEASAGFRHGQIGVAPENTLAIINDDVLQIVWPDSSAVGAAKSASFSFSWDPGDICFSANGLFAVANGSGELTVSATELSDESYFRLEPLAGEAFSKFLQFAGCRENRPVPNRSAPIKLFWWRPENNINLGDAISPRIVSAISKGAVVHATYEEAELYAAGSVLSSKPYDPAEAPIYVWGTGVMDLHEVHSRRYRYCAVRGPLTRACVTRSNTLPVGDPGLLVSRFWKTNAAKKYRWGIIPHFTQLEDPIYQHLLHNTSYATLIDATAPDIDQTIQRISECDCIAATSLHGLIIADSFEIPNVWLKWTSIHKAGHFKFYDYFASVGRPDYHPLPIDTTTNLDQLKSSISSTGYFKNIPRIQNELIDSFPAELTQSRTKSWSAPFVRNRAAPDTCSSA